MTTAVVDLIARRRRGTDARYGAPRREAPLAAARDGLLSARFGPVLVRGLPAFGLVMSAAFAAERWLHSPGRRLGV
jgi:hypothetical protein